MRCREKKAPGLPRKNIGEGSLRNMILLTKHPHERRECTLKKIHTRSGEDGQHMKALTLLISVLLPESKRLEKNIE